jgi:hypothetical protein
MPNAPDPYRKPERDWTGKKRRSLFRPRRLEHLAALAPIEPSTDGRDGNGDVPPAGDRHDAGRVRPPTEPGLRLGPLPAGLGHRLAAATPSGKAGQLSPG